VISWLPQLAMCGFVCGGAKEFGSAAADLFIRCGV